MDSNDILGNAEKDIKSLIGIIEDQGFEAKQEWPDLSVAKNRWEFAKDVAAMANGGGGLIVYGVATIRIEDEQADKTSQITFVYRNSFNENMAYGVLREHVVPPIEGLRFCPLIDSSSDSGNEQVVQCVLALCVPKQAVKVILCKPMEGNEALKEFLFGFAERDHDGTRNWSRDTVVSMIRNGTSPVALRLETIEQQLSTLISHCQGGNSTEADYRRQLLERIEDILNDD